MLFLCALLILNSAGYDQQYPDVVGQSQANSLNFYLSKVDCKKSNFEDSSPVALNYKLYAMFTYDAQTLRDQAASDSIFTNHRARPSVPFILNNFDTSTPNKTMKKQNVIYDNQSGLKALLLPRSIEFISFNALVKEQFTTKNLDVNVQNIIESGDIYASKYYPLRSNSMDHGHVLNLEARFELPVVEDYLHEKLQLITFVDTSPITIDQYSWASQLNHTTINGAGFGISWTYIEKFALQVYFANELESQAPAIPPNLSQLFWFQAVKYF